MSEDERITVGAVSAGGEGPVDLPVVELLTGRGFVTGKSGSGKSNTASVVAEKLLDGGYGLLIVDIDGEYYGLKEEYEILHVGADEECDIQVGPQHAERIAQLALEKHVPIILDVSSFLDESEANELLLEVARHLFAKEKKLKRPFLLVVEEVHEYLPEGGGLDECGRMLIKVAKRGRKHGLGMCGISQRPADVKKDFITQCDWLVWHRLTWQNDTKVVKRILGSEYADGVEELNDGEGYLMTDWDEGVRQVQFQRKRTFDAGATPGLDDFERPELKSVSDDLVSDLERITEEQRARESRVKELERELEDKERRIEELEAELEEARDLSDMAEQFSRAMMAHATGRPFREDVTGYRADLEESSHRSATDSAARASGADTEATGSGDRWREAAAVADVGPSDRDGDEDGAAGGSRDADDRDGDDDPPDEHARPRPEADGSMTGGGDADAGFEPAYEPWPDEEDLLSSGPGTVDAVVGEKSGEPGESAAEAGAGGGPAPDRDGATGETGTAEADGGADILVPGDESEAETGPADWDGSFDDDAGSGEMLVPGETTASGTPDAEPSGESRRTGGPGADRHDGADEDPEDDDSGTDIIVPGETDDEGDGADAEPAPGAGTGSRAGSGASADADSGGDPDDDGGDIIVTDAGSGTPSAGDASEPDPGADHPDPSGGSADDIVVAGAAGSSGAGGTDEAEPDDPPEGVAGRDPGDGSPDAAGADRAGDGPDGGAGGGSPPTGGGPAESEAGAAASFAERDAPEFERPVVREIRETVESLDPVARGMLAYYRSEGPAPPVDAQVAAGGDGDRTRAYARNGELREAGLVAHAGRGRYGYALRSRIDRVHDGRLDPDALEAAAARVEAAFLDRSDAPWPGD